MELSALSLRLRALSVLRGLQRHPFVSSYLAVFDALKTDDADFARAYGALCAQSLRQLTAGQSRRPAW